MMMPKTRLLTCIKKSVRDIHLMELEKRFLALAVGGMDRKITLFSLDGEKLWDLDFPGWVNRILSINDNILVADKSGVLALISKDGCLIRARRFDSSIYSLCVFDVDGDEMDEVIVGTEDGDTYILDYEFKRKVRIKGEGTTSVIVADEESRSLFIGHFGGLLQKFQWKNKIKEFNFGESVYVLYINDINDDGMKEVLVGGRPPFLMIMNHDLGLIATKGTKASILAITDAETQWGKAILIGCRTGLFWAIDVNTLREIFVRDLLEPITQFLHADVNKDGSSEIIISNWTRLHVINRALARIAAFEAKPEWIKKILVYDVDDDNFPELIVGLSNGDIFLIDF